MNRSVTKNACSENIVSEDLSTNKYADRLMNEKEKYLLSCSRKFGISHEFSPDGESKEDHAKRIRRIKNRIKTQELKCQKSDIPDAPQALEMMCLTEHLVISGHLKSNKCYIKSTFVQFAIHRS